MVSSTKAELKLFYINLVEKLKDEIDLKVNSIPIKSIKNKYDIIRKILISKLNDLLKEVVDKINKNINPNIHFFLHNFQLFIFNTFDTKHNYSFNKVVFRILHKHIHSKDIIVYVNEVYIDEIDSAQFIYLYHNNISINLKIKSIKIRNINSLKYLPKNIDGLCLKNLKLTSEDITDLNEFTNLSYIDISNNKLESFSYTNNSLLELNIEGNKSLKKINLNNTIESINLIDVYLIDFAIIQSIKSLKYIYLCKHTFNQNSHYFKDFKVVDNCNSIILTNSIVESLTTNLKNDIVNNNLKFLKIGANTLLKLTCPNLEILKVKAYDIDYNILKDLNNLKDLSLCSYFNDDRYLFNLPILNNLTILTIEGIQIPETYIFSGLDNLIELNIDVCSNIYNKKIFSLLKSLEILNLDGGTITNETFIYLINLKKLILREVKYNLSNDDLFDNLNNLVYLKVLHSPIPQSSFYRLENLEYLYYSNANSLNVDKMHNLKELELHCKISIDEDLSFNQCLLETVSLTSYNINKDFIFNYLPSLTSLQLYVRNKEYNLNKDIFINLPNLKILKIRADKLHVDTFYCLLKLIHLEVYSCHNLSLNMFTNFKSLEYLKIDMCNYIDLREIVKNNPNLLYFEDENRFRPTDRYCNK